MVEGEQINVADASGSDARPRDSITPIRATRLAPTFLVARRLDPGYEILWQQASLEVSRKPH